MNHVLIRLDDACEYRNKEAWDRMEEMLDNYSIKPLVGIIPHCEDDELKKYGFEREFRSLTNQWKKKGWTFALHGYNHVYGTVDGGINPVNKRSEFAGVPLDEQKLKIRLGVQILQSNGIDATVFFAPSHTFDVNTMVALREESSIRTISDCVADKPYLMDGFTFIPQQTGRPRKLPFKFVTICLHPNTMTNKDFIELESFLKNNAGACVDLRYYNLNASQLTIYDKLLNKMYYILRKIKNCR